MDEDWQEASNRRRSRDVVEAGHCKSLRVTLSQQQRARSSCRQRDQSLEKRQRVGSVGRTQRLTEPLIRLPLNSPPAAPQQQPPAAASPTVRSDWTGWNSVLADLTRTPPPLPNVSVPPPQLLRPPPAVADTRPKALSPADTGPKEEPEVDEAELEDILRQCVAPDKSDACASGVTLCSAEHYCCRSCSKQPRGEHCSAERSSALNLPGSSTVSYQYTEHNTTPSLAVQQNSSTDALKISCSAAQDKEAQELMSRLVDRMREILPGREKKEYLTTIDECRNEIRDIQGNPSLTVLAKDILQHFRLRVDKLIADYAGLPNKMREVFPGKPHEDYVEGINVCREEIRSSRGQPNLIVPAEEILEHYKMSVREFENWNLNNQNLKNMEIYVESSNVSDQMEF